MPVVKIRKVGNSNVMTLPAELETQGFAPGVSVVVEMLKDGSLHVVPVPDLTEHIRGLARATVARRRQALAILEAHDREEADALHKRA